MVFLSSRMSFCLSSNLNPNPSTSLSSAFTARPLTTTGWLGWKGEGGEGRGGEKERKEGREREEEEEEEEEEEKGRKKEREGGGEEDGRKWRYRRQEGRKERVRANVLTLPSGMNSIQQKQVGSFNGSLVAYKLERQSLWEVSFGA